MLFNSFAFLVFFAIVTSLYFILPFKMRWLMLLVASCIFYMFFIPVYILILFATIIIDYFAGILIEKAEPRNRKKYLIVSLVTNIGILAFFKYFNFFIGNINEVSSLIGWNYSLETLKIVLPIGLSFHTFQAMSYTIEVYRGKQKAERHFGIYALYVMYYPQLVAGPIERPQNLLPQFHTNHGFDYERVSSGLKQMLWGFFKKVVIADRLASFVNPVYEAPHQYQNITLFVATLFFAFQIFCDFSGYSDIALGASRVMGIELMQNFRSPYFSKSISEFWSRWHISLSTWFKDYLYIPLGGNRVPKYRWFFNLFFVFLISGFWHGASWTFVIWGALHGFYLIAEIVLKKGYEKTLHLLRLKPGSLLVKVFQTALVFYLVCLAWIFFRAENVSQGFYVAKAYLVAIPDYLYHFFKPGYLWLEPLIFERDIHKYWPDFAIIIGSVALMELVHYVELKKSLIQTLSKKPVALRWSFYMVLIYSILLFGVFHSSQEFIYFQF